MPVPDGPHTTRFSCRSTHSRLRRARCVGAGIDDSVSSQASKVLPVGNPAALRRARIEEAWRPASSSASSARMASAGSQRCAFAVASRSGAAERMCGRRSVRSRSTTSLIGAAVVRTDAPRQARQWLTASRNSSVENGFERTRSAPSTEEMSRNTLGLTLPPPEMAIIFAFGMISRISVIVS